MSMTKGDLTKSVYLRVPTSLHKRLKVMAAEEERSMQQVYISALRAYADMPRGAAPKGSHP